MYHDHSPDGTQTSNITDNMKFIVIEDQIFNRISLVNHLQDAAPGCKILAVDVKPSTNLWDQLPADLTGQTVFLDNDLGQGWPEGQTFVEELRHRGAHVLCISERVTFPQVAIEDVFDRKFYLDVPSSSAAEDFRTFVRQRAA